MVMITRREFFRTCALAAALKNFNLKTGRVLAANDLLLDTSELPGFAVLRYYAQQLTLVDPYDLEFKAFEREAIESMSMPYKVNGAQVYRTGGLDLFIGRPDRGHKLFMTDTDSHGALRYVEDVWLKGHLGGNEDTITITVARIGSSTENSWWHGYGGYGLFRYRPLRKNEAQSPTSQFEINGRTTDIGENNVLEGIASYDTTRAPLLTGIYEGTHAELMARRNQVFRQTNFEYRKNLQRIIHELEKEGKIKL